MTMDSAVILGCTYYDNTDLGSLMPKSHEVWKRDSFER